MIIKPRKKKKKGPQKVSKTRELAKAILLITIIGTVLRIFVVSPHRVETAAMQNGLYPGDFLLASKLSYKTDQPAAGDLILFSHPLKPKEKLVSRVVALEGQTVQISGKTVYINGQPTRDFPGVQHSDYRILPSDYSNRDYMALQQVPPGHVFVLGDNRDNSQDSRNFGFVPNGSIEGKGLFVYFSWAPDPRAPKLESPYIIPAIHLFIYNAYRFPSRVRWDRLFI
jgi:signal peptidase I